jgi:valyl-tRNA synthetase
VPWTNAAISGWVLDPDRKKMSKSKGNVVTPLALLKEHGSDGVRYWAARGGPGVDTAFDPGQMKIGRKLAMKILNVSKFVLAGEQPDGTVGEPLDRGMLQNLAAVVDEATAELERYEYTRALAKIESFFWDFCDNYVEAAKSRRYGDFGPEAAASASTAMRTALSVLLRLLAPYLVFVTEEAWSWSNRGSIHRASWPTRAEIEAISRADDSAAKAVLHLTEALTAIRKGKTEQKVSVGTPVKQVVYRAAADAIACLKLVERDLKAASRTESLVLAAGEPGVEITLKPAEA